VHVALHALPAAPLSQPRSHCSPASMTPSPQRWSVQIDEHRSPQVPFEAPSSHSSVLCWMPSPHFTGTAPRARMYGIPDDPSAKLSVPPPGALRAIASGMKGDEPAVGKPSNASCTEHDQFERIVSVRPASAGLSSTTMWELLKQPTSCTV